MYYEMDCTQTILYNPRISNSHTYSGPAYGEQIYPINLLNTNWDCLHASLVGPDSRDFRLINLYVY